MPAATARITVGISKPKTGVDKKPKKTKKKPVTVMDPEEILRDAKYKETKATQKNGGKKSHKNKSHKKKSHKKRSHKNKSRKNKSHKKTHRKRH